MLEIIQFSRRCHLLICSASASPAFLPAETRGDKRRPTARLCSATLPKWVKSISLGSGQTPPLPSFWEADCAGQQLDSLPCQAAQSRGPPKLTSGGSSGRPNTSLPTHKKPRWKQPLKNMKTHSPVGLKRRNQKAAHRPAKTSLARSSMGAEAPEGAALDAVKAILRQGDVHGEQHLPLQRRGQKAPENEKQKKRKTEKQKKVVRLGGTWMDAVKGRVQNADTPSSGHGHLGLPLHGFQQIMGR